ncbi:MAG: DUF885 domain-containing protein [Maricaulis sp.]|jgi:uncharacterized protein (DUF885 family)|nr:DUF885 domain-containing protein [Maricaulis sp.]
MTTTKFRLALMSAATTFILAACSGESDRDDVAEPANNNAAIEAANDTEADVTAEQANGEQINAWFEDSFEAGVARSPIAQTFLGRKTSYGEWDNVTPEFAEESYRLSQADYDYMTTTFDPAALPESAQLSYDLFEYDNARSTEGWQWRDHGYTFTPRSGPHMSVPSFLINNHRVDSVEDAEAYISRIRNAGAYLDQHADNARRSYSMGIQTPRWTYQPMIVTAQNVISGAPFDDSETDSPILADFRSKVDALDIEQGEKDRLISEAETALTDDMAPAYERLIAMFGEQEATARETDGVWDVPGGADFYAYMLQGYTTTDMTAEEIHDLGLAEVDRIHAEMEAIMDEVGFEGDLQDFFDFMRTDPQFYYTDEGGRDRYLAEATALIDTMGEALPQMFNTFPQAELEVRRVEEFREASAGKAFYQRPAPNGTRPGVYYANLRDMNDMPTYQMEALAYHEGIPGHHMQLAIMQELEGVPSFRRFGGYTAYTEGWGLYSEYFPVEFGFYDDPYSDFGRLAMELWRACRLVVDTGLHHHRWTRQEAVDYLAENTPNPQGDIVNAIDRYIVYPGQATAYMIGRNEILRLREMARDRLGDAFDIRDYHDVVLRQGALPLSVLETRVNAWVERELANQTADE